MDVLFNASSLNKGGGIQVAVSFLSECITNPKGFTWHYALSREVVDGAIDLGLKLNNFEIFDESPARSHKQRKRLKKFEQAVAADVVFTLFGPAYVKFSAPHLLGVAVGWVTHSTWLAYSFLPSWVSKLNTFLVSVYKGWWLRAADHWIVEAENARIGLNSRMHISIDHIDVIPNACSSVFYNSASVPAKNIAEGQKDPVRLLYVASYYPHKNIEFVPQVAAALKNISSEFKFEFTLTLPQQDFEKISILAHRLEVIDSINNIGKVPLSKLPELYAHSDICFMPSVLETFSANYIEAMASERPVIASDLDFSRAVCKDSAVYFDPRNPDSAAKKIIELLKDENLRYECILKGNTRLKSLPTSSQRYELYVDAINKTLKEFDLAAKA
ncbi:MAG: glycosyltransferase [Pseudomonadota bacterium]|nr:glycosyltransferase [Pseudomonadota bacterium]